MTTRTLAPLGALSLASDGLWRSKPHRVPLFGASCRFAIADEGATFAEDVHLAVRAFLALEAKAVTGPLLAYRRGIAPDAKGDPWAAIEAPEDVVVRRRHRFDRAVYLLCECTCEWDREHGVQLVFRGGTSLTRVSGFDDHLTDADAYGWPSDDGPGALPVGAAVKRKPRG